MFTVIRTALPRCFQSQLTAAGPRCSQATRKEMPKPRGTLMPYTRRLIAPGRTELSVRLYVALCPGRDGQRSRYVLRLASPAVERDGAATTSTGLATTSDPEVLPRMCALFTAE